MELIIIGLTLLILFMLWDRSKFPRKYCRSCKGSGKRQSWISGRAFGVCRSCNGKGELRR